MEARAKILGHPIHQMLIPIPFGLFTTAAVLDVPPKFLDIQALSVVSFWNLAIGVVSALVAAVFGLIDWTGIPKGTRAKGLAFIMGWTGGYVLVALFLAPFLRKFGQFTIPDFLDARYGGHIPRTVGIFAAILCSFTYVVAQIYGVGLITARLTGVTFELGIFLDLGGILVCSFLGGMRAVTWTQVAQNIILIIAYLLPPIVMSQKVTGVPIPELMYGQVLQKIDAKEKAINADPKEAEVRALWQKSADDLAAEIKGRPGSLDAKKAALQEKLAALRGTPAGTAGLPATSIS